MNDQLHVTLCVDAVGPQAGGIGRYAWELSQRLPHQPQIGSVRYFARRQLIDDPIRLLRGEPIYPGRALRRIGRALIARRALSSTVVHAPNYFLPAAAETGVITVHDLSVFLYPETHPPKRLHEFELQFLNSLDRAAHVITDTETIRSELIGMFGIAPEKVTAAALGVSQSFRPIDDEFERDVKKLGLSPGGYGLSVSTLEPRKKLAELIIAWRRLPIGLRDRHPLVLAGGSGWMNEPLRDEIERAGAEGWLVHLGHVDEADLPALYSGAALFVYPSIYEGFGLPPVEAMASGVPVIVANRSCIPEVCGDAPRYVDPDDDNDFLTAIEECLVNSDWRKNAINRGLERAAGFTWDRCVQDTVAVYRTLKSA